MPVRSHRRRTIQKIATSPHMAPTSTDTISTGSLATRATIADGNRSSPRGRYRWHGTRHQGDAPPHLRGDEDDRAWSERRRRKASPGTTSRRTSSRRATGSSRSTPAAARSSGNACTRHCAEIDEHVDAVDVFRPSEEAEGIARDTIAMGARVLWFQPGTHTEEAASLGHDAGLTVVTRRCMGVTHGWLGLGPGPHGVSAA